MKETMNEKKLDLDELESVSGGSKEQNNEIVALYNKYHPEDPADKLSVKVQLWVWDVMGYDYSNTSRNRPHMYLERHKNEYQTPDHGLVSHYKFMKLLNEKLADYYG